MTFRHSALEMLVGVTVLRYVARCYTACTLATLLLVSHLDASGHISAVTAAAAAVAVG